MARRAGGIRLAASPCIPQRDGDATQRAAAIGAQLDHYPYTWHRPEQVATAYRFPKADGFPASAGIRFMGAQLALKEHELGKALQRHFTDLRSAYAAHADAGGGWFATGQRWLQAWNEAQAEPKRRRATPEVCASLFDHDQRPPLLRKYLDDPGLRDALHAWQRLAGSNPLQIRLARQIPESFAVTPADFARAVGDGDSLEAAAAEDRLYIGDWTPLHGLPTGSLDGQQKYLYGPWALYLRSRAGAFLPIAIQCGPTPGPQCPIYTPADGALWEMAKLVVQNADTQIQALHLHLGRCHFVMEAFTLATMRQLAVTHPVRILLAPSMEFTLAINAMVRDKLMMPGANMSTLLSPKYFECMALVTRSVQTFELASSLPDADIAARGVGDPEALPEYPWRDDSLDIWACIHAFVTAYVQLYYDSDGDVDNDLEVRAWADDMRAHFGGRLSVATPQTRAALADLISYLMFVGGPLHAVANYSQFDNMSFAPNMPTALYGAAPSPDLADPQAALAAMYMPESMAVLQYGFFWEQTQLKENLIGQYPEGSFTDPRVADLVNAFQESLAAMEQRVIQRNAQRLLPFTWLLPSTMTASIHS